jgi:hypothetical protein
MPIWVSGLFGSDPDQGHWEQDPVPDLNLYDMVHLSDVKNYSNMPTYNCLLIFRLNDKNIFKKYIYNVSTHWWWILFDFGGFTKKILPPTINHSII